MNNPGEVEISFEVQVSASVRFWIQKETWEKMNASQREISIRGAMNDAGYALENEAMPVAEKTSITMSIDSNEYRDVQMYDPEEGETTYPMKDVCPSQYGNGTKRTWDIYQVQGRDHILLGQVEANHNPGALLAAFEKFKLTTNVEQKNIRAVPWMEPQPKPDTDYDPDAAYRRA